MNESEGDKIEGMGAVQVKGSPQLDGAGTGTQHPISSTHSPAPPFYLLFLILLLSLVYLSQTHHFIGSQMMLMQISGNLTFADGLGRHVCMYMRVGQFVFHLQMQLQLLRL